VTEQQRVRLRGYRQRLSKAKSFAPLSVEEIEAELRGADFRRQVLSVYFPFSICTIVLSNWEDYEKECKVGVSWFF
jgi:hypothetical protein